jgi:hypothetical protein
MGRDSTTFLAAESECPAGETLTKWARYNPQLVSSAGPDTGTIDRSLVVVHGREVMPVPSDPQ